ncbi:MAG: hypothetical protein K8R92_01290 [Planctomycetes bacterium]|nr:hypothetical protein [Planctomycetota bacterium]
MTATPNPSLKRSAKAKTPRSFRIALAIALPLLLIAGAVDQEQAPAPEPPHPDYSAYTQSYRIPFANPKPVDFEHLQSLSVRVSLNGGPPLKLQVDTGSCGVIVGADDVPNIDPNGAAGSITYSSSGIELIGIWTPVTLTFPDSKDELGNVATAIVPVLAVTERKVHAGAVNSGNSTAMKNPKVHMLGIGTGRGKLPRQDQNPWVNLKEMQAGTMRRGYTITRDGVTLGLTARMVGSGYLYEQLKEHVAAPDATPTVKQSVKDWEGSRGWVTVGGLKTENLSMLLDTGLTNMMIPAPEPSCKGDVAEGTEITVHLLSGRLSHSFKVGDAANPAAPRKVTWVKPSGSLINTGLRALARYDYLYDADGGYVGLRPVRKNP